MLISPRRRSAWRRTVRGLAVGALALSLFIGSSAPAYGEVAVGDEAPDFDAAHYFNSEPVKISDLKGRLVLVELFSTT